METPCVTLVSLMFTTLGDKFGSNSEAVTFFLLLTSSKASVAPSVLLASVWEATIKSSYIFASAFKTKYEWTTLTFLCIVGSMLTCLLGHNLYIFNIGELCVTDCHVIFSHRIRCHYTKKGNEWTGEPRMENEACPLRYNANGQGTAKLRWL